MAEVRGSSPLSSTADDSAAPTEVVGAHEFRNRFGLYLERAAAGTEVRISRHGRPYARLVPADLNLAPVADRRASAPPTARRRGCRPHKIGGS